MCGVASAWIVARRTKAGEPRWHVKWEGPPVPRPDGTTRSQLHLGAFKTEAQAKARKKWAENEWAAGRVPDPKRILAEADQGARLSSIADEWFQSRLDLATSSRAQYASRVARIQDDLGGERVNEITPKMVREWVARLNGEYAPATTGILLHVLRLILDHAEIDPNPARHRSVKLPKGRTTNQRIRLPTSKQLAAIRKNLSTEDQRRLLDFLEDTGATISEACGLDWSDVHADKVLIRGTKREARVRFAFNDTHPIRLLSEPRGTGRVFNVTGGGMRNAMTATKIGPFSPHDLRHLHLSRLLHQGVSPAVVAARAGHATPATTLKVYTHVVPPD